MPGKKQVRLAFCDLAPDWDARDNYFTQALEHAGWEITFCNGPEEKPDFVLCGTFGFDFLKYDCCRIQFSGEDSWPDLNCMTMPWGSRCWILMGATCGCRCTPCAAAGLRL